MRCAGPSTWSSAAKRRCSARTRPAGCSPASRSQRRLRRKMDPDKEVPWLVGLRDRALIGVMVDSFARISAVVAMEVEDYFSNGKRWWLRLHEKGGKRHEMPAHHNAEEYLDAYLDAVGIWDDKKSPLFRSVDRTKNITENPLARTDVL